MSSNTVSKKTTPAPKVAKATPAKKEELSAPASAAVTPAPTSAAASKTKSKTAAVTAPAPVVAAPVAAVAAPAVAAGEEPAELNLVAEFNAQVSKVNELRNTLGAVLADMKKLEKRLAREIKKAGRRRRTRVPVIDEATGLPVPKKPSVFTKPQQITDDLCVFLGKAKATQMSRSDVTRGIMDYVKRNGLNNKQDINPDAALRKLLKVDETEKVTILNLQRYLKIHYIKAVVPGAPVA